MHVKIIRCGMDMSDDCVKMFDSLKLHPTTFANSQHQSDRAAWRDTPDTQHCAAMQMITTATLANSYWMAWCWCLKKLKVCITLWESIAELLSITCHLESHNNWHRWMCHALTQAKKAGTWFIYPWRIEGWIDLDVIVYQITKQFNCLQTVSHSSSNNLISTQLGVKLLIVVRTSQLLQH